MNTEKLEGRELEIWKDGQKFGRNQTIQECIEALPKVEQADIDDGDSYSLGIVRCEAALQALIK